VRAGGGQYTSFSNRAFTNRSLTQDQALNIKWSPTARLHFNFDGQYVYSKVTNVDDIVETATFSAVNIDQTGSIPQITPIAPGGVNTAAYFANPKNIFIRDAFNNASINDGHEWAFKADAQYDVSDDSFLRKVRVGGRYSKRSQTVRANDYNNWGAVSDVWTSGLATLDKYPGQVNNVVFGDFFRGQAVTPPTTPFISDAVLSDHAALMALLRKANAASGGTYTPLEDRGTNLVDGIFKPNEIYRNSEETYAAYARADFALENLFGGTTSLSGNIGVRWVHTNDASNGSITFPSISQTIGNNATVAAFCASANPNNTVRPICTLTAAQQAAIVAFSNGGSSPDVATQSFDKWLPALNLKFQATSKLLFRFAASKAISRPNFGDLRDFVGVNPSGSNTTNSYNFEASSKNPFLKPIDANQLDLTAEWYFAKVGSLTGAVFYKDLSNIILDNYGYTRTLTNNGQSFAVTVNGPANATGHAKIKGAEISYQQTYDFLPGALRGLGTQATFTYIEPGKVPNGLPANGAADGSRPPLDVTGLYSSLPLAGLSKYNYNVSAFYDLAGVYARVAYSWRSKYLLTNRDCCFPFLPVNAEASGQMDASLFYTVNKQFKIGVQVQNLLDATTRTSFVLNSAGLEAPRSYFKSDRQFQMSGRLSL
jgi:TonB-dependent receptor